MDNDPGTKSGDTPLKKYAVGVWKGVQDTRAVCDEEWCFVATGVANNAMNLIKSRTLPPLFPPLLVPRKDDFICSVTCHWSSSKEGTLGETVPIHEVGRRP